MKKKVRAITQISRYAGGRERESRGQKCLERSTRKQENGAKAIRVENEEEKNANVGKWGDEEGGTKDVE